MKELCKKMIIETENEVIVDCRVESTTYRINSGEFDLGITLNPHVNGLVCDVFLDYVTLRKTTLAQFNELKPKLTKALQDYDSHIMNSRIKERKLK